MRYQILARRSRRMNLTVWLSLTVTMTINVLAAPGDLDPTFGKSGKLIDGKGAAANNYALICG